MIIEIKVPSPGESISEVQLANWLVNDGDYVEKDQEIAEVDSDKATLSISAEQAGIITLITAQGSSIEVGAVVARIDTGAARPQGSEPGPAPAAAPKQPATPVPEKVNEQPASPAPATSETRNEKSLLNLSPLARKILESNNMTVQEFEEMIRNYRISRQDVEFMISAGGSLQKPPAPAMPPAAGGTRETERKKMSTLRLKLAERLVSVKNETAMLTTFNEVNMTPIMKIRQQYKDIFKEKHGISLGFMSFFTKAVTEALYLFPQVNAQIDGEEMVFHQYADIGIAVSTPKGLMVPVIRNAEVMTLARIELAIRDLATKARDGKLTLDEMKGGTFTITNGGVFGSMLSTPIINPPQSAILGMHNIVERPVAVNGQVEIHPVMYVALSYDHRIIDGRESVSFLVKVKEMLENPTKMLFRGADPMATLLGL
jgi:2-oxoglutarate dehydrogenase E2 component (dihydrolipoamide succinyltransferase)